MTHSIAPYRTVLQNEELYNYILETSVYLREPAPLKAIRDITANHPRAFFGTNPDACSLMAMLLKLVNAKKTLEVGVFTGYSLLLTALNIPDDGQVVAIDLSKETYEIGLPIIEKAGVAHKINFIESEALPVLDNLLEDTTNEGSFDFAFIDADKNNYINYHERMINLVRIGGLIIYDNTLWGGTVSMPEEEVPLRMRGHRHHTIEFNKVVSIDQRIEMCHASVGDGLVICKRII